MNSAVVICALLCLGASVQSKKFDKDFSHWNSVFPKDEDVGDDDWGHLKNCGDAKHNFTFQWKPKQFKAGDKIKVNLDFTAQNTISQVTSKITVWALGIPDPILKPTNQITCAEIKKYIPQYDKYCPLKKGQHLKFQGLEFDIPTTYPIPAGTYNISVVMTDQVGLPVLCGEGQVHILQPPQPDWDDWRR